MILIYLITSYRNQIERNFIESSDLSAGDINFLFPYDLHIPPKLEFELNASIVLIGDSGLWNLMKVSSGLISQSTADQCGLVLVILLAGCLSLTWISEFMLPDLIPAT